MELNHELVDKAHEAFNRCVSKRGGIEAAIETYLTEMFRPDKGAILEPLEAIPQRDYRKELWIGAYLQNGRTYDARIALEGFDRTFPKENNHG